MNEDLAENKSGSFPFGDGLVVTRRKVPGLFLLNPTAAYIWESLKEGIGVEEISSSLSEACRIPYDTAECDVKAAVRHWAELGLTVGDGCPI